jgi:signal transduction histidine kinase
MYGFHEVSEHLATALQFLENLATEVFPSIIQDIGLLEALELECERLSNQLNIQILFSSDSASLEVDRKLALNIFRIFKEKIISLGFHGVNEIVTTVGIESGFFVLKIFYDTKNNTDSKESLVIENIAIEERIKAINGLVSITVNTQQEYNFEVSIPTHFQ